MRRNTVDHVNLSACINEHVQLPPSHNLITEWISVYIPWFSIFSIPAQGFLLMNFSMNFANGYESSHMRLYHSMDSMHQRANQRAYQGPQEWISYKPGSWKRSKSRGMIVNLYNRLFQNRRNNKWFFQRIIENTAALVEIGKGASPESSLEIQSRSLKILK